MTSAVLEAAKLLIFPRLNGMNPEGMVAELSYREADRRALSLGPAEKALDVPRLSTGIAGVMSGQPTDTTAALEMLDHLRNTGGSEAFWREDVAPMSAERLRGVLLWPTAGHCRPADALDEARPRCIRQGRSTACEDFDPPAGDIVLEFVPDQFDQPAIITLPDGTTTKGMAPIGNITAKVRDASRRASGARRDVAISGRRRRTPRGPHQARPPQARRPREGEDLVLGGLAARPGKRRSAK